MTKYEGKNCKYCGRAMLVEGTPGDWGSRQTLYCSMGCRNKATRERQKARIPAKKGDKK
jgi:hypothetical protein